MLIKNVNLLEAINISFNSQALDFTHFTATVRFGKLWSKLCLNVGQEYNTLVKTEIISTTNFVQKSILCSEILNPYAYFL